MAKNLKLLSTFNKRVITKIELSRLEKIKVGTREIELLAKKIEKKDGKRKRNVKNVMLILRDRLKDAMREEKRSKVEYEKDRENLIFY